MEFTRTAMVCVAMADDSWQGPPVYGASSFLRGPCAVVSAAIERDMYEESDLRRYLLIALGGAIGALLRYVIGASMAQRYGARFPYGTLTINLSACFIIGLVLEYFNRHAGLSDAWRYLIPIGFIGAYSTFSTFEYEAWQDITRGAYWNSLVYVTVSIIGGFVAVGLGATTARALA